MEIIHKRTMEIIHKVTDAVLYSGEAKSLKDLLEQATQEKADLCAAFLCNADLRFANLSEVSLRHANLRRAYLNNADLNNADLRFAYLSGVDFRNADLRFANLWDADLSLAKIDYQIQEGLLLHIAYIITAKPNYLKKSGWHTCETTCCLAGWACHLSPVAKELEKTHGTQIAGLLTLGAEAHSWFFLDKEIVLENLQKLRSK